jgi:glutamyl-tRNA synthetase
MTFITRIAPSPTGDMHLGTARTAYFCWLAARASSGKFILRVDDTDAERSKIEYLNSILDTMKWLGLDYDTLLTQSQRVDRYLHVANQLIADNKARVIEGGAIALLPTELPEFWVDRVVGNVAISDNDKKLATDLVLVRSNGMPTYNFASVIDDIDLSINFIIRGSDHIPNTAKQVAIFVALNAPLPEFAHIGLIHYQKKKLSKRDGAASMLYYRDKGYDPDAVLNFMLRLGWGPTIDDKTTKLLPRERALELFLTGGAMRAASSNMDLNLLESFDRKYKAQKGQWRTGEKLV